MKRSVVCLSVAVAAFVAAGAMFGQTRGEGVPTLKASPAVASDVLIQAKDIGLIDVRKVFKRHSQFAADMEQLKEDLAATEKKLEQAKEELKELRDRVKAAEEDSAERDRLNVELAGKLAALQGEAERHRRRFTRMEADLYAATYKDVMEKVKTYAGGHGLKLVLKYDSSPFEPETPEDVMKGVNRSVMFQSGLDITDEIIRLVSEPSEEDID